MPGERLWGARMEERGVRRSNSGRAEGRRQGGKPWLQGRIRLRLPCAYSSQQMRHSCERHRRVSDPATPNGMEKEAGRERAARPAPQPRHRRCAPRPGDTAQPSLWRRAALAQVCARRSLLAGGGAAVACEGRGAERRGPGQPRRQAVEWRVGRSDVGLRRTRSPADSCRYALVAWRPAAAEVVAVVVGGPCRFSGDGRGPECRVMGVHKAPGLRNRVRVNFPHIAQQIYKRSHIAHI